MTDLPDSFYRAEAAWLEDPEDDDYTDEDREAAFDRACNAAYDAWSDEQ